MTGWLTPLLTRAQAAEALAVSPWTLDRLRRDHGLPAIDVGGAWRYDPADIGAWIQHNRRSEPPCPSSSTDAPTAGTTTLNTKQPPDTDSPAHTHGAHACGPVLIWPRPNRAS